MPRLEYKSLKIRRNIINISGYIQLFSLIYLNDINWWIRKLRILAVEHMVLKEDY